MKSVTLLIGILISTACFAQSKIDNVLRRYKNNQNVFSIKYEGESLDNFIKARQGEDQKKIKSKLTFLDVYAFKNQTNINKTDLDKIQGILKGEKYEMLISAKTKEGKVQLQAISTDNVLNKVYASLQGIGNETYYVLLSGNIYLNELAQIAQSLNMKELDFIKGAVGK